MDSSFCMRAHYPILIIFLLIIVGCGPAASSINSQSDSEAISGDQTGLGLTLPDGYIISLFTPEGLGPIRFMAFSPDGILFVSLPSKAGLYKRDTRGGAIIALPDRDQDGIADETIRALTNLQNRPHGLVFYAGYLYVAQETGIVRYPYLMNGTLGARSELVTWVPHSGGHLSRTIGFAPSGKMYFSIGSLCNVCEEKDKKRAAILEYSPDGSNERVFAHGTRNAVGFVFHPESGEIWATENSRDKLGDDLPPDEINILRENKHYGWPFCYGKKVVDPALNNPGFCENTEESTYDIQAHSAPLGLRFIDSTQFPDDWQGDLLVAYHGSWNRKEPTGYKIVRLDVEGDEVIGEEDFITGWLKDNESVIGRPVDVIFDDSGNLFISDDKTGYIYRVSRTT